MLKHLTLLLLVCVSYQERFYLKNILNDENCQTYADFNNTVNTTGWAFLRITTNHQDDDVKQFHDAGFLEGYLTKTLINNAYDNYVGTVLEGNSEIDGRALQHANTQIGWMKNNCIGSNQTYWKQVCNLLSQLEGMYEGYVQASQKDEETPLDFDHFYYLTNMGDMEDIIPCFNDTFVKLPSCNSLTKLTKDNRLIVGHNTFNIYSLMLRVYKTYHFALHDQNVKANLTFSSRPGDLNSKDDFYMLKESQLVVVETSLNNYNRSNYKFIQPESLPTWIRVSVASRLATNPKEWAKLFSYQRSGTHNNQWVVTKLNQRYLPPTLMVEESFYFFKVHDLTKKLLSERVVASFNVPYDQEIYDTTGYEDETGFNYDTDPRSVQFQEMHHNAQSPLDVGKLLRANVNTTQYDICLYALSPRCDLQTGKTFGGIDGKVVDFELMSRNEVLLISSPTYQGNIPPFSWKTHEQIPHNGMQDDWRFPWFIYNQDDFSLQFVAFDE